MLKKFLPIIIAFATFSIVGCDNSSNKETENASLNDSLNAEKMKIEKKVEEYALVKLTTDISVLTEKEKQMIPILIQIADIMDEIYWEESFGDKKAFLDSLKYDGLKKFALINYGPWDRLDGDKSFVNGFGTKPLGANFYPQDITKAEFEAFEAENKTNQYSIIKRNADGKLQVIP